jgi:hypothetical protein
MGSDDIHQKTMCRHSWSRRTARLDADTKLMASYFCRDFGRTRHDSATSDITSFRGGMTGAARAPPTVALEDHSPAAAIMSEARQSIVAAMLMRFSRVTFRSHRSMRLIWERDHASSGGTDASSRNQ